MNCTFAYYLFPRLRLYCKTYLNTDQVELFLTITRNYKIFTLLKDRHFFHIILINAFSLSNIFIQAILRREVMTLASARRLMQLFLSYPDLPSLEVVKCDEVALDLVENTWTSRSGIECRLVIQLTRDSRVYIARGVRDMLLTVISSQTQYTRTIVTRMYAARNKVTWHNASIRGDYRDISRTGASASYLHHEYASDRSAIRREWSSTVYKNRTCISALLLTNMRHSMFDSVDTDKSNLFTKR